MLALPAVLGVSEDLLKYVTRLLCAGRRVCGTRTGAAAFGMGQVTAYLGLHETIDVLTEQAPDLDQTLEQAVADLKQAALIACTAHDHGAA